jgi:hypothetical protein
MSAHSAVLVQDISAVWLRNALGLVLSWNHNSGKLLAGSRRARSSPKAGVPRGIAADSSLPSDGSIKNIRFAHGNCAVHYPVSVEIGWAISGGLSGGRRLPRARSAQRVVS